MRLRHVKAGRPRSPARWCEAGASRRGVCCRLRRYASHYQPGKVPLLITTKDCVKQIKGPGSCRIPAASGRYSTLG